MAGEIASSVDGQSADGGSRTDAAGGHLMQSHPHPATANVIAAPATAAGANNTDDDSSSVVTAVSYDTAMSLDTVEKKDDQQLHLPKSTPPKTTTGVVGRQPQPQLVAKARDWKANNNDATVKTPSGNNGTSPASVSKIKPTIRVTPLKSEHQNDVQRRKLPPKARVLVDRSLLTPSAASVAAARTSSDSPRAVMANTYSTAIPTSRHAASSLIPKVAIDRTNSKTPSTPPKIQIPNTAKGSSSPPAVVRQPNFRSSSPATTPSKSTPGIKPRISQELLRNHARRPRRDSEDIDEDEASVKSTSSQRLVKPRISQELLLNQTHRSRGDSDDVDDASVKSSSSQRPMVAGAALVLSQRSTRDEDDSDNDNDDASVKSTSSSASLRPRVVGAARILQKQRQQHQEKSSSSPSPPSISTLSVSGTSSRQRLPSLVMSGSSDLGSVPELKQHIQPSTPTSWMMPFLQDTLGGLLASSQKHADEAQEHRSVAEIAREASATTLSSSASFDSGYVLVDSMEDSSSKSSSLPRKPLLISVVSELEDRLLESEKRVDDLKDEKNRIQQVADQATVAQRMALEGLEQAQLRTSQLEIEIADLEKQIQSLQNQIHDIQYSHQEESKALLAKFQKDKDVLERNYQELSKQKSSLEQELRSTKDQLQILQQVQESASQEFATATESRQAPESKLGESESTIATLEKEKESLNSQLNDMELRLKELNTTRDKELDALKEELAAYTTRIGDLENELGQTRDNLEKSQSSKSKLENRLQQLTSEMEECQANSRCANQQIQQMTIERSDIALELDKTKTSLGELLRRNQELDAMVVYWKEKQFETENLIQVTKDNLATQSATVHAKELDRVQELESSVAKLEEQLQLDHLSHEARQSQTELKLEETRLKLTEVEDSLAVSNESIAVTVAEKESLLSQMRDIQLGKEQVESKMFDLEQTKMELETRLRASNEEIKLVQRAKEESSSHISKLQSSLDATTAQYVQSEKELADVEKKNKVSVKRIAELEGQIQAITVKLVEAQKETKKSHALQADIRDQLTKMTTYKDELKNQVQKLNEEKENSAGQIESLHEELKILQARCHELDSRRNKVETSLADIGSQWEESKHVVSNLSVENENLNSSLAETRSAKASADKLVDELKVRLSKSEQLIDALEKAKKDSAHRSAELERELSLKSIEYDGIQEKLASKEQVISSLQADLHSGLASPSSQVLETNLSLSQILESQNRLAEVMSSRDALAKDLSMANTQCKEASSRAAVRAQEIENLKKELECMKAQNSMLDSQRTAAENKAASLQRQLEVSRGEMSTTQGQLVEMESAKVKAEVRTVELESLLAVGAEVVSSLKHSHESMVARVKELESGVASRSTARHNTHDDAAYDRLVASEKGKSSQTKQTEIQTQLSYASIFNNRMDKILSIFIITLYFMLFFKIGT